MAVENHIYNNNFFQNTIKLESASAAQFVTIIKKYYQPHSLVDIGCGAGIYLKEFSRQDVKTLLGIDGAVAAQTEFLLHQNQLIIFDLAQPYQFTRSFDLALCLEVAEHLQPQDANILIDTITAASADIIFSAAIPGQGPRSIGHINEQPHEYWINKFTARGFNYLEDLTLTMRAEMKQRGVVWWIVNNLLVFQKRPIGVNIN